MTPSRSISKTMLIFGVILFLVVGGFLIPISHLIRSSQDGLSIALFDPVTLRIAFQTLVLSIISLVMAWIFSYPLALAIFRNKTRLTQFTLKVLELLWIIPTFVYDFLILWTLRAFQVEELYSLKTVGLAWVLVAIPFLTVGTFNALKDIDPREREAFRSLGGKPSQESWNFDFPKIKRALQSLSLHQLWLFLTSFTLVVLLNGGPPNETLEVGIYTSVRMDHVHQSQALALATWQFLFLVGIKIVLSMTQVPNMDSRTMAGEWFKVSRGRSIGSWLVIASSTLMIGLILFLKGAEGLGLALLTGVALSLWVAFLSVIYSMGAFMVKAPWISEWGAWFSPMVFSLAWWKVYGFTLPSFFLCVGIQVLLFAPWVSRILYPLLERRRDAEVEAMRSLGATPIRAWWGVEWPRIRSEVYWTLAVIFSLSLSDVTSVILFARGDFEPLSVWTQNQFMHFQLDEALYGTILLVLLSMIALSWVRRNHDA